MNTRRLIYATLLSVAVVSPVVLVGSPFVKGWDHPLFLTWAFVGGPIAMAFLCVWGAVYVRDEPRLIRIALVWIALVSLFVTIGVALTASTYRGGDSKEMRVRADIQWIRKMLLSYNETNGHNPSTDQGLQALVPRFMEEVPKDAWGTPYVYRCPGKRYPNAYDLFSAGPDRVADTADDEW